MRGRRVPREATSAVGLQLSNRGIRTWKTDANIGRMHGFAVLFRYTVSECPVPCAASSLLKNA